MGFGGAVPSYARSSGIGQLGSGTGSITGGLKTAGGMASDAIRPGGASPGGHAATVTGFNAGQLATGSRQVNEGLGAADQAYSDEFLKNKDWYLQTLGNLTNDYKTSLGNLSQEAETQAKDATTTYSNNILPGYKDAMSAAKVNADAAMTLEQASDPNNKIMKQIRALYDQQGQAARKTGQQDFGVLSALGAQAAQGQFGAGGPMTSGQMGQIYGANQQQAGDAYARAQQRMYDLQAQGLDKSFDQSNKLYEYGQAAQGRYSDTIKDLQGGEVTQNQLLSGLRSDRDNYANQLYGAGSAVNDANLGANMTGAGIAKGNAYASGGREQEVLNQYWGANTQGALNALQAQTAQNNGLMGLFGSGLGAAATYFGSSAGGGAAGGAAAAASDQRLKTSIDGVTSSELDEFLKAVKPKTYEYKDTDGGPGRAQGKRVGFMMQDVQGTKLGKQMTRRGPSGELMYDKDNLNGILLAGLAREAKRAS